MLTPLEFLPLQSTIYIASYLGIDTKIAHLHTTDDGSDYTNITITIRKNYTAQIVIALLIHRGSLEIDESN